MRWLGQGRRAFDMLCERALTRFTKGSVLADKQTVQNWIADSWAEMQAARLMTLHAAWTIDQHGTSKARTEIAGIKFFDAKVLHDVIDRAMQIHGSLGMSNDLPLETMYRHALVVYDCALRNGFAELSRELPPGQAGRCVTGEYTDPLTGDTLQPTTGWKNEGGLFVFRKSDGALAYTDGYQTWLLGPRGLERPRLNTERYPWEKD
jgi:hypothetical protein